MEPEFKLDTSEPGSAELAFSGDWLIGQARPEFPELADQLQGSGLTRITCNTSELGEWDSALPSFLLQCHNFCLENNIELNSDALPEGARSLLTVATAVATHQRPPEDTTPLLASLDPARLVRKMRQSQRESLQFIGEVSVALARLFSGRANTRRVDFLNFIYQAGPSAFAGTRKP